MYLKEDQKSTGKGNSLIFTKHIGIISSLVFELEVVVGCESIKDNYYVCLFWLDFFLCTYYGFFKEKTPDQLPFWSDAAHQLFFLTQWRDVSPSSTYPMTLAWHCCQGTGQCSPSLSSSQGLIMIKKCIRLHSSWAVGHPYHEYLRLFRVHLRDWHVLTSFPISGITQKCTRLS